MHLLVKQFLALTLLVSNQLSAQSDTSTSFRVPKTSIGIGLQTFSDSKLRTDNPHSNGWYQFDFPVLPQVYAKRVLRQRANKAIVAQVNADYRKGSSYSSSSGLAGGAGTTQKFSYCNFQFALAVNKYRGKQQKCYVGLGVIYNQRLMVKTSETVWIYTADNSYYGKEIVDTHPFALGNVGAQIALGSNLPLWTKHYLHLEGSFQLRSPLRKGTGLDNTLNFLAGLSF